MQIEALDRLLYADIIGIANGKTIVQHNALEFDSTTIR